MKAGSKEAATRTRVAQTGPCANGTQDLLLDIRLYPHRSLERRHFRWLFLCLLFVCAIAGLRFALVGAWPVAVFLGVDIATVWLAFHLNYRSAQLFETLQLSETDLILTRIYPSGRVESWRFDPYWVRLDLKTIDEDQNRLSLSSHGKTVVFGTFLTPADRQGLMHTLNQQLAHLKG